MKFLRSKRGIAALALLILILFLFRPGVYKLRQRIAWSIGSAIGRRVALDNVRIHLLPRPGFDLEGLVIYDDPAFSAEPMVRAQDVSAAVRFRPLLRWRLEIATLSANEPSINLVRNDQGQWNLASLIERSSQIPVAPTGKPASERRPAFPYLEANNARINFKIGQAKKSWALTDADVALWQDSENSWGARMKAQPVRTDFNLTDTGTIQVNASWQRAASLSDTPVQVAVQWQKGQLGQLTKLFSGRDRGWRGGVNLQANLSGTPRALTANSALSVDEFRRYDILSSGVRLSTNCSAHYSTDDNTLGDILCDAPVQEGSLRLRGRIGPFQGNPEYDLHFAAEKVPLASLLLLLRQTKKDLPADLVASGRLDAGVRALSTKGSVQWTGEGTASGVRLLSNRGKDEIVFGDVPLTVFDGRTKPAQRGAAKSQTLSTTLADDPMEAHLQVGPFPLGMGAPAPATASGWISASGYRLAFRGDTQVQNLYRLENTLGVAGFHPVAEGSARLDVSVAGIWQGFAAPQAIGTVQLRNLRTGVRGFNPPIDITSAIMKLDADTVTLDKIAARTGDTHWTGSVMAPRHCAPEGCVFQFDLGADQLSSAGLVEWFTPSPTQRPWYRILAFAPPEGKSPLLAMRARGRVRVNRLTLKKVIASEITGQVDLDRGKISLTGLRAQVFQGSHQGNWVVDASTLPPHYQSVGNLQNVSMAELSAAMNDPWATGSADGKFTLTTSGDTFADVLAHADGDLQFTMHNGTLTHVELPEAGKPFPVHLFSGELKVKSGSWKLNAGRLQSHDGMYLVSGTAAPGTGLNLLMTRGDEQAWNVTGTLLKPKFVRAVRTEARAKP